MNAILLPLGHILLKRDLMRTKSRRGMESLVGIMSTTDNAPAVVSALKSDWSKRICGMVLLDATAEEVGQLYGRYSGPGDLDDFMDWIRRAALDEIYVDIPMDSGESFLPYLEEMESMGLTYNSG